MLRPLRFLLAIVDTSSARSFSAAATMAPDNPTTIVVERVDDIRKPAHDDRLYRGLVLNNQMKMLLISDAKSEKAAASLDIHIGHMSDPAELPGIAHFLEHMVFLGSDKYPKENEFESFVSEHGGQYNAYTAEEHTNFYFDVGVEHFRPAIDRFAQFFVSPNLSDSGAEREVKAVHSEHENNITNDSWRIDAVQRASADPAHPWNQFGTGNLETLWTRPRQLGVSARDALLDFHRRYYSSNLMCLCVLGRESLDELQSLAVDLLFNVPNRNATLPSWENLGSGPRQGGPDAQVAAMSPLRDSDLGQQLSIVPVKDIRILQITWPIFDVEPFWRAKPEHLLAHLIGHEGSGSLLSELKRRGWCNTLSAGGDERARGFGFLVVQTDLTVDGLAHTDEIISLVYRYIGLLRVATGIDGPETGGASDADTAADSALRRHYDELAAIDAIKFRYKDKQKPLEAVRGSAADLHYYPLHSVIAASYQLDQYRPDLVRRLVALLLPDRMRVVVVAKSLSDTAAGDFSKEYYYGAKYRVDALDEARMQQWRRAMLTPDSSYFHLPEPNSYIPQRFNLMSTSATTTDEAAPPTLIHRSEMTRLWHSVDSHFRLPKAVFHVELCSPGAVSRESVQGGRDGALKCVDGDPLARNLLELFQRLYADAVAEDVYPATLAGLHYQLQATMYGLTVSVLISTIEPRLRLPTSLCQLLSWEKVK